MTDQSHIRPYKEQDKDAVMHLLRLNTPEYFAPEEEKDLLFFLENEIEYYYAIALDQQIVGCGGFNFSGNEAMGKISWDILHPDFQGQGLGSKLLAHRIEKLKTFEKLDSIIVRTTQLVYPFYEKGGFKLTEVVKDYWAKGFDLYYMIYQP